MMNIGATINIVVSVMVSFNSLSWSFNFFPIKFTVTSNNSPSTSQSIKLKNSLAIINNILLSLSIAIHFS